MLSPYTVLDLTDDKGELAGMVLGDLGADVIKVEPPRGSSSRRMGPFLEDAQEPERSLQFLAFNRNKRGITLDLSAEAGRSALLRLAEGANFLLESARPGEMHRLGLGFDAMRNANPRIVYVAITPYGQDGPHAEFAANDLTLAAMGGPMSLQGVPGRAPVRITVPQVWLHASAEAAVGALTAHALMLGTDQPQFVDVSAQAAMVWTMLQGMAAHAIQGFDFKRRGATRPAGSSTVPLLYECADGYIMVTTLATTMPKMVHWMVEDGVAPREWIDGEDWPTFESRLLQGETMTCGVEEVVDAVKTFVRAYTKVELLERGLQEGVSLAPVSTMEDLARFRQLEDRGYWLAAPLPGGGQARVPGILARLTETPMSVRRWAPRLGQHNQEILGGQLGLSTDQIAVACGANVA
ncbi:MAG: hypothetical protein BZY88_02170 [SAR202 cluster bacterium Io17-Chloro-G9]|nr:MAG: hypothetical protein BZY88_02170 [SAR202 cluster bacterium Io17-Chloro-G9]